jgi:hypothetical protein
MKPIYLRTLSGVLIVTVAGVPCTLAEFRARVLDEGHPCRCETPHTHNDGPTPSSAPYAIAFSTAVSGTPSSFSGTFLKGT